MIAAALLLIAVGMVRAVGPTERPARPLVDSLHDLVLAVALLSTGWLLVTTGV